MTETRTHGVSRVMMTVDAVGGIWTYALELAGALGNAGVEVILARMGPCPTSEQRRAVAGLENVRLVGRPYRLEWMSEPWDDVDEAGLWLLGIADEYDPDVIQLNGFSHAALAWGRPVLVVAHSCVFSWMNEVTGAAPGEEWGEYHRRVRRGLESADQVIAPTMAMLSTLTRNYGDFPGSVAARVVPNARSHTVFRAGRKEDFVFAAGRIWDEAKNAAAVARVSDTLRWPVCLAGELRRPDGGESSFAGIRYLGRLEPSAMASWFARAAIFAHPARYEPFGLTPLEAALSSCALVVGDIPSLREVWGNAALYAPPEDSEALAHEIDRLIDSADLRRTMGLRARRRALEYSPHRMRERYLRIYHELISVEPGVEGAVAL